MKKLNILLLLLILTIMTTKNFAQAPQTCKKTQSTKATLQINGLSYTSNDALGQTIIINIPNGQNTISGVCGYQSLSCQDVTQVPGQGFPPLTPRTAVRVYQGSQFISVTDGVWGTTTTSVNLSLGLSTIQVSGNCQNGT
jgi:hypothetical protein